MCVEYRGVPELANWWAGANETSCSGKLLRERDCWKWRGVKETRPLDQACRGREGEAAVGDFILCPC